MIIGISGKSKSGKDETGRIIKELFPQYNFTVKKFADKLKEITALLLGSTRADMESQEYKATTLAEEWWIYNVNGKIISYIDNKNKLDEKFLIKTTPRWLLQNIGTECFRKLIHPNVWVNSTFSNYDETQNIIVTDVRFPNEANAIKQRGGIVIRISRPTDDYSVTHTSETALDDYNNFDIVINNNGTITELETSVKNIFTNTQWKLQ